MNFILSAIRMALSLYIFVKYYRLTISSWPANKRGRHFATGQQTFLFADGHVRFLDSNDINPARDGFPNPNITINGIRGIDWPR